MKTALEILYGQHPRTAASLLSKLPESQQLMETILSGAAEEEQWDGSWSAVVFEEDLRILVGSEAESLVRLDFGSWIQIAGTAKDKRGHHQATFTNNDTNESAQVEFPGLSLPEVRSEQKETLNCQHEKRYQKMSWTQALEHTVERLGWEIQPT